MATTSSDATVLGETVPVTLGFRVLGPLEIRRDGDPVVVSAPKQRVILASLLLEAGRVVTVERLIEHLWGDEPSRNAKQTLQVYVTRLREALGDDVVHTVHEGYRIEVGDGELDLAVFESLVERAAERERAGDDAAAAALLTEALALWHGEVLSNVPSDALHRDVVPGLDERRLRTLERRIHLDIRLGRADDVVTETRRLTSSYPLRERLWGLLMRALYFAGRQAEALEAYREVTELLADQLGIDPGQDLRDLHQSILTGELAAEAAEPGPARVPEAASAPPRQLPGRPAGFVGRDLVLDRLVSMLGTDAARPTVVLSGPPGVGKSALATCAGHLLAGEFPDGQLFVDLHGFSASAAPRTTDVLARFLRALGMAPGSIPVDPEEQAAAYRSLLAGRRVLVVLDNAASAAQVRSLLPGDPGCGVLVTSRSQLRSLVAIDGARPLSLDVLSEAEALALLAEQVGRDRLDAEPAAAAEVAGMCGYLPLALRIAGANLALRPYDDLADYVAELRVGDRLTNLWAGDDERATVAVTFESSYAALEPSGRELFRLLGLVPGPDFTKAAVAALQDPTGAAPLDTLVAASLVQPYAPGRFRMHDLIRGYAEQRGASEDDAASRGTHRRRLFGWYLAMVDAALVPRFPNLVRLARRAPTDDEIARASIEWIDDELPNILAALEHAAEHGPPDSVWHLADALRPYFTATSRFTEWATTGRLARAAAERAGDDAALAGVELSLSALGYLVNADEEAVTAARRAIGLYQRVGDTSGEAAAWHNLGVAYQSADDYDQAIASIERSVAIFRAENHRMTAPALSNLALLKGDVGRLAEAAEGLAEGAALSRRDGDTDNVATATYNLGNTLRRLGRLREATAHLETALRLAGDVGNRFTQVKARIDLVRVHCDAGDLANAEAAAAVAIEAADALGAAELRPDARVAAAEVELHAGRPHTWLDRLPSLLTAQEATGSEERMSDALDVLARTCLRAGDLDRALDAATRLTTLGEKHAMPLTRHAGLTALATVLVALGRYDEAVARGTEALAAHRETGYRLREARTLCALGDAALAAGGDAEDARRHWGQAEAVYTEISTAEVAEAERRLATCRRA